MTAKDIQSRFAGLGVEISEDDIESRIKTLTEKFKVPVSDAENSVISYFLRDSGIERGEYYTGSGGNQTVSVADLPQDKGQWVNLRVKLTDIWDTTSEHITQTGLIGDETGKTKFVLWRNACLGEMELDKSYILENVVTSVYLDRVSITLNKTSVITEIDDDIEVGGSSVEYTGVMVKIKDGSGLIKRCPECNRALRSGTCAQHGNVDGVNDLRIMAVFDDGLSYQDAIFNRELTEALWEHTLDGAVSLAVEALDASVVMEDMERALVGKYYTVSGGIAETTLIVKEFKVI